MPEQLTRRDFLKLAGTSLAGVALAACAPVVSLTPVAPPTPILRAEGAWSRPAMSMAGHGHSGGGMGAVFVTLINEGEAPDRLLSAQCEVADVVELHETIVEDNVAKMQPVAGGIDVPARGRVELKPGGYHVMLIGLRRPLMAGERFPVVLQFEHSGALTIEAVVREP